MIKQTEIRKEVIMMDTAMTLTGELEESKDRFLTFDLGSEKYGIMINYRDHRAAGD